MSEIKFPLEVSNPCLFYANGVREPGHGRPCICSMREGDEFVRLIEIRSGTNAEHRSVRHVDDPVFDLAPGLRKQGVWDYSPGIVYDFGPKPAAEGDKGIEATVVELAKQGKQPGQIAAAIATKGWTAARIQQFLESRSNAV